MFGRAGDVKTLTWLIVAVTEPVVWLLLWRNFKYLMEDKIISYCRAL